EDAPSVALTDDTPKEPQRAFEQPQLDLGRNVERWLCIHRRILECGGRGSSMVRLTTDSRPELGGFTVSTGWDWRVRGVVTCPSRVRPGPCNLSLARSWGGPVPWLTA